MTQQPDDHTIWQELVAGYALNALDPADEAALVAHLDGCAACRAERDEYALTASHLAALADDESDSVPAWSAIRGAVVGDAADVVSLEDRSRRRRVGQRVLAAAAAVIVVTGASVAGWQAFGSGSGGPHRAVAAGCVGIKSCSEIALRSSDGVHRATVIVSGGVARMQPVAMSRPASGRTYVLWQLPRGGAPIPLTEFASATAPSSSSRLPVPLSQTTAFAVSIERADVHPTQPTDVVAIGSVST
ncbi:MAG TPA: anti-sigma factor [Mycobacteriales bacterium]|nr:anti-sigma factor [Mycobacteriales bacterium]